MHFLLIKTEKSLLSGFHILLVKIHLNRAQCLWDAKRTEKAVTRDSGLLRNSAFLQLARTHSGNVQKAVADVEKPCGHFPRRPCTAPVPGAVLQPWSDVGPLEPWKIIPLPSKSLTGSRSHSTRLFVEPLNGDPKLNSSQGTFHPKELQPLFWDTTPTPIPPESCLGRVCAAKGNSLRHQAQVEAAGSQLCSLELTFCVLDLSRSELHGLTTELKSDLTAKQH